MRIKNGYRTEYKFNKEKNAVTSILTLNLFDSKFRKILYIYDKIKPNNQITKKLKTSFIGVARLKENDNSNLEVGMRIAKCKALRQANRYYGKLVLKMREEILNFTNEMRTIGLETLAKGYSYETEIVSITNCKSEEVPFLEGLPSEEEMPF